MYRGVQSECYGPLMRYTAASLHIPAMGEIFSEPQLIAHLQDRHDLDKGQSALAHLLPDATSAALHIGEHREALATALAPRERSDGDALLARRTGSDDGHGGLRRPAGPWISETKTRLPENPGGAATHDPTDRPFAWDAPVSVRRCGSER